ncbi:MAG TPA: hypothetical protein VN688_00980 [Gemmataceae bacterium]|nr:hypothetical protein [Gemmataceae bacterium]
MATATKSRKPATKSRKATIGTLTNGKLLLCITQGSDVRSYLLTPIPSDFGTGFHLLKGDNGDGSPREEYDVLLAGRDSSCTCKGHTYHGHCKHVESLTALHNAGKLNVVTI